MAKYETKSKARNPKHETISKDQIPKFKAKKLLNSRTLAILFGTFENLNFEFVSDLEFFKFFSIYYFRYLDLL